MKITDYISKSDLGEPYDRLSDFLDFSDIIKLEQEYGGRQIKFRKNCADVKSEYPELVILLGVDKARRIINILSGIPTYFPALKSSCRDKIKTLIINEFNGYNYFLLARKYGYSERHIRNIIVKSGKRRHVVDENQLTIFDSIG